jgi:hypothetical protein
VDWPDRVPGAGEDDGEKEPGDAIPTGTGGGTGGVAQSGPPQSLDAGAAPSADSDSMAPAQDAGVAPDAAELDAGDASSEAATRS